MQHSTLIGGASEGLPTVGQGIEGGEDMCDLKRPSLLQAAGADLLARLPIGDIELIPLQPIVTAAELRQRHPEGPLMVCDFCVTGLSCASVLPFGFEDQGICSVDHHAETLEMARPVSSGNLALEYVRERGTLPESIPLIVNHTDCDSVLSSLIVRGHLPPLARFGEAVVAADHTGAADPIADLLQALDPRRDLNFSARNLGLLLCGDPLEPEALKLLAQRHQERERAEHAAQSGCFALDGGLAWGQLDERIAGELLPVYFPRALVVMAAVADADRPGRWQVKIRLGAAAPAGFRISELGIEGFDSAYGGRWNAGSNRRGGGTTIAPAEYARQLKVRIKYLLPACDPQ